MYKKIIQHFIYLSVFIFMGYLPLSSQANAINTSDQKTTVVEKELTLSPFQFVQTVRSQSLTATYKKYNELKIDDLPKEGTIVKWLRTAGKAGQIAIPPDARKVGKPAKAIA